mmetsp:Transcript_39333/g.98482  ORF Transcript_39333/g.98482 Transcript_39333/m.98482 type:complete len:448 (+) Transcript_39333:29-1372(+)
MRGRGVGLLLGLCAALCLSGSTATCPTFTAWLRPDGWAGIHPVICGGVQCNNLDGFVSITVAPDAASITVSLQIQAAPDSSNIPRFLSAGLYGPALPGEAMPETASGPLFLVEPAPSPTLAASTWSATTRLRPSNLPAILEALRTGMAFFSVSTDRVPEGELRGQMHPPTCLEAQLRPAFAVPPAWEVSEPYAFVSVMVSGAAYSGGDAVRDMSVHFQLPTDRARSLSSAVTQVKAVDEAGASIVVIQPNPWDSCVRGSFDGRNQGGLLCTDQQRHTYASEVNLESQGSPIFHVEHQVAKAVVDAVRNATSRFVVETVNSRNDAMADFEVEGRVLDAVPCRRLMSQHDSLYSIARDFRSDWVTLWSLNDGNPDVRKTLEPRYYAHPLQVLRGETSFAISRRYGMTEGEILKVNPAIADINTLPVGSVVCVVPNWQATVAGNGQRVCT